MRLERIEESLTITTHRACGRTHRARGHDRHRTGRPATRGIHPKPRAGAQGIRQEPRPPPARPAAEATPERSTQPYASEKNATPTFRKSVPRVHACTGRTGSIAKKRHAVPPSHRDAEAHEPSGRTRRKPRIDKQCMIAAVTACNSTTGARAGPANIQQRHARA